jgi:ABC-type xylose transport system permease subunit
MTTADGRDSTPSSVPPVGPWFVPGRRRRWWVGLRAAALLVAYVAVIVVAIPALGRTLDPHVGDSWPVGVAVGAAILVACYAPAGFLALARRRRGAVLAGLAAWLGLAIVSIPGNRWNPTSPDFVALNRQLSNGGWVLFAATILPLVLVGVLGRRDRRPAGTH